MESVYFSVDDVSYAIKREDNKILYDEIMKHHKTSGIINFWIRVCTIEGIVSEHKIKTTVLILQQIKDEIKDKMIFIYDGISLKEKDTVISLNIENNDIMDVIITK